MDIISKRNIFFGFSGILVLASWLSIAIFGLKPGIDLVGGTQWQLAFQKPAAVEAIRGTLSEITGRADVSVRVVEEGVVTIRLPAINEASHQQYLEALRQKFGPIAEDNFSSIGPTIGSELRRKAFWAMALVLLGISLYVAWAFRKVGGEVKSWKYGLVTLLTLVHDVSIPAGLFALLGYLRGIEIDTNFIVALLVVMGFSVHDTIVVFDRIRENLLRRRGQKIDLAQIVNFSVNETFVRSINTSLTLVFVLIALMIWGPATLFYFILTILVGTVFGTYSSIFVASPLLYLWGRRT